MPKGKTTHGLQPEMLEFIKKMEDMIGRELYLTSAYRSPEHPIEAAKKRPGEHAEGLAIDVACATPTEFLEVAGTAYVLGCKRIGVSRTNGFIHLGLSPNRPTSLWTY